MKSSLLTRKYLIPFAFAVIAVLTLFGFIGLLGSPYTGLHMNVHHGRAIVESIDAGSPASEQVERGDRPVAVNGEPVASLAFNPDPNYIKARGEHDVFWAAQRRLSEHVAKGRPLTVTVERGRRLVDLTIVPAGFPLVRAIVRTLPLYAVGWIFAIVAFLVLKKKDHEITVVNLVISVLACMSFISFAPYELRDLSFPYPLFRVLSVVNSAASLSFSFAAVHMMLVFPRRRQVLIDHPWIGAAPYFACIAVAICHFAGLFDNTYVTLYVTMNVCLILCFGRFLYDYFMERNELFKKQIQWVIFGMVGGISMWLTMTSIPITLGLPFVSKEISVLPTVVHPIFFAIAVTRYRLMNIENIFDTAVVYGVTLLILVGLETTFLGRISPLLFASGQELPVVSLIAVLLIVLVYVPVRNFVKRAVDRLFKRGVYDPERELHRFSLSLGMCDERTALEKFISFSGRLFQPSGIIVYRVDEQGTQTLYSVGKREDEGAGRDSPQAAAVWERLMEKGGSVYGYEIEEDAFPEDAEIGSSLLVPFVIDPSDKSKGYFAILSRKRNGAAYSIKDVTLLNALAVSTANIIDAGELRRERVEIEERFRKEKDVLMRELHDGLGNILTSITVTTQAADRMPKDDTPGVRGLVARIGGLSAEATEFLRAGLTVLDDLHCDLAAIIAGVKERYGDVLESLGMELDIQISEDTGRYRPGVTSALQLLRVLQESISNAAKHSSARTVRIRAGKRAGVPTITVRDDGKGFDPGAAGSGYGLVNMRRRVEEMNGALEIESSPGSGTTVLIEMPSGGGEGAGEGRL